MNAPDAPPETGHYDELYFSWQKRIGEFSARENKSRFSKYLTKEDVVLDFGCGGGYLLKELECRERIGVDISPQARNVADQNGLKTYATTSEVENESIDVVLSNNALEHTLHPFQELTEIYKKLKPNGKAVFVVPCESISRKYNKHDLNQHLYSWSPMCIGNLFTEAGFHLISISAIYAKFPPFYFHIRKYGGTFLFKLATEIFGRLDRTWFQVKVVAEKR